MAYGIRLAGVADAEAVAQFFTSVYEAEHGDGAALALEMLARTLAGLFPEQGVAPLVWVYETESDGIQGATAVKEGGPGRTAELISLQVFDTVQGKGIAHTLLSRARDHAREAGATGLLASVDAEDHRARGFLRREGFEPVAGPDGVPAGADCTVQYVIRWADA